MTQSKVMTEEEIAPVDLERGVEAIRVIYPDLHGIARGKDVPLREFDRARHGLNFCSAVMATDLRHTPVLGGGEGYPDMVAVPDEGTLVRLPWEPEVATCLADLHPVPGGPAIADPRGLLRKVVAEYEELGLHPVVGPELEFFLVVEDADADAGVRRHLDRLSMVYTVGPQADPGAFVRRLSQQLSEMELGASSMNHEFMNSQYEINLDHGPALEAADRAFLLRSSVKDAAARNGLLATFIGKPFNDQGGSGLHLHVSLEREGENAFAAPEGEVADLLRWFTAGVLEHAPAAMAFLNPTVNAYRRLMPDSLAPTHVNWGWDNRSAMIRIPAERGAATRIELRVADSSANPYLATAATLISGLDGIRKKAALGEPVAGDAYHLDDPGPALPESLGAALDALEGDEVLRAGIGPEIFEIFLAVKRFELERNRAWVSDWEIDEYLRHL
jgi:glutamine synthetase